MAYTHGIAYTSEMAPYWATQAMFADTLKTEQPASTLGCNMLRLKWTRTTPSGTSEDAATINFHIAKVVGGGLYSALIPAEFPPIEALMDTAIGTMNSWISNSHTMTEYRWFEKRASHGAYKDGSEVVGPPVRITTKSLVGGSATAPSPYQDSSTVTWRTCSRKHWGRVYMPGLPSTQTDTFGRLISALVDGFAGAWHTFLAGLITNSQTIGVWTYRHKAFLDISELRVDNVPDVQRRRRAKQSSYAKSYTS